MLSKSANPSLATPSQAPRGEGVETGWEPPDRVMAKVKAQFQTTNACRAAAKAEVVRDQESPGSSPGGATEKRRVTCGSPVAFLTQDGSCESETLLSQHVEHRDAPNPEELAHIWNLYLRRTSARLFLCDDRARIHGGCGDHKRIGP